MLRTLFICSSLSRRGAGIFEVQKSLANSLVEQALATVEVVGVTDDLFFQDGEQWRTGQLFGFPSVGPTKLALSPQLMKHLSGRRADVIHLQALWLATSIYTMRWKAKMRKPSLITPNGMLEPWALRNSRMKKKIAWILFEGKNLRLADCIQANTLKELEDIRRLGLTGPVCVIPNGVDIPKISDVSETRQRGNECTRILYLGRIHEKKGLAHLVDGLALWKRRNPKEKSRVQLIIAGRDQDSHIAELIDCAEQGGLCVGFADVIDLEQHLDQLDVIFIGPTYGDDKRKLFSHCDIFALPSLSEGQPMAILEALAHGIPTMLTRACNFNDAFELADAIEIQPNAESIQYGINSFLEMSSTDKKSMGEKGRKLVQESYTWGSVARQIAGVYQWLSEGGPKPDEVICD